MIFRSNLIAPDLAPHFKLLSQPRGYSFGHDVPSDPDFQPDCGFWTHDEAAIIYTVAFIMGGCWLDIGCRFGWTSAHIAAAGAGVVCLDPNLMGEAQHVRFEQNMQFCWKDVLAVEHRTAQEYLMSGRFVASHLAFDGFVIDGCHDAPEPLNDAVGCVKLAKPDCVIMLHDFYGQPVRDAVTWLMRQQGFHARIYWTPNGVALCWRWRHDHAPGYFTPPEHKGDPRIYREMHDQATERFPDFDFAALS